ncbi:MAG: DoxX family protein [Pseudomonadota bacterium]
MEAQIDMGRRVGFLVGRFLLGLYFLIPGITKITGWDGTAEYMAAHGVPLISVLLPLTILIQVGGGIALMIGYRAALVAFVLAGLTLVINLYMHDFWNVTEAVAQAHETQNFVKNLAIFAGLLFVAGAHPLGGKANAN